MKDMHELKNLLCEELDEIAEKGSIGFNDLQTIQMLTASIKNIMRIDEMNNGGSSYGDGRWSARGSYNSYGSDGSYARDGRMMNSYGDDNGYSSRGRHYVRGHYSYDDGVVMDKITEMMDRSDMSLDDKSILKKAMDVLRR